MELPPSAAPNTDRTGVFTAGELVNRKYVVERVIGEGGLGVVVSAHHRETKKAVAIKIARAADPDTTLRFRLDARAMTSLKSPHTVRVLEVGDTDGGLPCFVMELLEGQDLASKLRESGPVAIDDAIRWMGQTCEALAEAHAAKIVHRALKPENLFLAKSATSRDISIRVLDFGMTLPFPRMTESEMRVTSPGGVVGASYYLAPEQVRNREIDARTDVWAVGACLFRLLTNRYPFTGTNIAEVSAGILTLRPTEIRTLRADIPAALVEVISRCLQKAPRDRYESMTELRAALGSMQDTYSSVRNTPVVAVVQRVLEELRPTPHMQRAADKVDLPPDSINPTPTTLRTVPPQPLPDETMTELRNVPATAAAVTPNVIVPKAAVPLPPAETATNIRDHVNLPPFVPSDAVRTERADPVTIGLDAPPSEDPTMIRGVEGNLAKADDDDDDDEYDGKTAVRASPPPPRPSSPSPVTPARAPQSSEDQTVIRPGTTTGPHPAADPRSSDDAAMTMRFDAEASSTGESQIRDSLIANESDIESADSLSFPDGAMTMRLREEAKGKAREASAKDREKENREKENKEKPVPQLAQLLNLPIILKRKEEQASGKAHKSNPPTGLAALAHAPEQKPNADLEKIAAVLAPRPHPTPAPAPPLAAPAPVAVPALTPLAGFPQPTPALDPIAADNAPETPFAPILRPPTPQPLPSAPPPPLAQQRHESIEPDILPTRVGSSASSPPFRGALSASPFILAPPLPPADVKTVDSKDKKARAARDAAEARSQSKPKKSGAGWVVVLLVLAVVGGGGFYLYRSNRLPASIARLLHPHAAPPQPAAPSTPASTPTPPSSTPVPPVSAAVTPVASPPSSAPEPPPPPAPPTSASPTPPTPPSPPTTVKTARPGGPRPAPVPTPRNNESGSSGSAPPSPDESILNKRK